MTDPFHIEEDTTEAATAEEPPVDAVIDHVEPVRTTYPLSPVHEKPLTEAIAYYDLVWGQGWEAIAALGLRDRFFLLTYILGRADAVHPWLYVRCREVEEYPDDHLDLWAREHYKSTLITFVGVIQEVLRNPEITIGIFSFSRPSAKKFMSQIKYEFESNESLKACYPNILWSNPTKEAPRWSDDRGIIVKRKTNPKEPTIEASGLVDGQPTGAHYMLRVYDDVVTKDSVTGPDMIEKTTDSWRLSLNLGAHGGRSWYLGTIYHFNDTYRTMMQQGSVIPRIYAATEDGTPLGEPIFISKQALAKKRRDMGPYIFAAQMLLNPIADSKQGFKREWMGHYGNQLTTDNLNKYIVVDPANAKKKNSDYTAMFVIGLGGDRKYYILDIVRDRLNLTERADALFQLHRKHKPLGVGYEQYGKDSDIQHFEDRMGRENYRFSITPLGGKLAKDDRIRALVPLFEQERVLFPEVMFKENYEGKKIDLVRTFVESEFLGFPVSIHDDMLDCLARILDKDMATIWPIGDPIPAHQRRRYDAPPRAKRHNLTWMSR